MLYMNYLVDMSSFTHPGGQWIFQKIRGREISRYIFGGFKLEAESTRACNHSHHAKQYLMGNVVADMFDSREVDSWPLYLNGRPTISKENWIFYEKFGAKNSTVFVKFRPCRNMFEVRNDLIGTDWIGKHYAISDGKKARLYSGCCAISEESQNYRENLINFYEGK